MGNIIESFASGFGKAVGKFFSSPVDFLSGKSCSSVCGSTWDLICYIENFCLANLLKLAMVFALLYVVLLVFYLLCKLGICGCIGRAICRMIWACFSSCFHVMEYSCTFLCSKLHRLKRRRKVVRKDRNLELYTSEEDYADERLSYHAPGPAETRSFSRRKRDYRGSHLRKSLRPRNHHAQVEISGDLSYKCRKKHISEDVISYESNAIKHGNPSRTVHDIRVTQTSKFVKKGMKNRNRVLQRKMR